MIGTQAVVQEDVEFARLGLVVIDEQHKFGVRQRASLKEAGLDPHYLVMTATPIPRTVTMTLFGDLDVSTLRDSPPGRQPVHTYLATPEQRDKWWEFVREKLREGRQGYVVAPLVEESEDVAAASVAEAFEALANGELEAFRLGLIHGRMTPAEKEAAMAAFRRGETQVLVSTTVVEVGVDVPNATLMAIESGAAIRPGATAPAAGPRRPRRASGLLLRVRRADDRRRAKPGSRRSSTRPTAFELAEIDFSLRGPGDLFGTKQHGLPPLRIADLVRDAAILEEARRDAQQLAAPTPACLCRSTTACAAWCWSATATCWSWATWGKRQTLFKQLPATRSGARRSRDAQRSVLQLRRARNSPPLQGRGRGRVGCAQDDAMRLWREL